MANASQPLRMIYIDDDEDYGAFIQFALQRLGHYVTFYADAPAALRAIDASHDELDLVLTDLNMPGFTGLEIAEWLRRRYPGLPCVVMSSTMSKWDCAKPLTSTFGVVAAKPDGLRDLAALVEDTLSSTRAEPLARSAATHAAG
jgi:CheY-like chemotaxis protein